MKSIYLFLSTFFLFQSLYLAAADNHQSGSRAAAMANATVALHDFWAISHNQAGISGIETKMAGMFAGNRFMVAELVDASFAVIIPAAGGNLGISLQYFGTEFYSDSKAGITYARSFGEKLATGVQLSYLYTNIAEGYGQTGTFLAEIGIIYEISPGLFLGTHVFNPTRSVLKTTTHLQNIEDYVSTIIRTGMAYHISNKVLLSLEVEKDIRHPAVPKIGIEYQFIESLQLRAGISNNPVLNTFGFGIRRGNLQLDISASHHPLLGYSQQAGLIFAF